MIVSGRIVSTLLVWLTAIAMPFQTGWQANCGCGTENKPTVALAPRLASTDGCCKAPTTTRRCCEGAPQQRTCCDTMSASDSKAGCQCGWDCHCVGHGHAPPTQPSLPASSDERTPSNVPTALCQLAVIGSAATDGNTAVFAAEAGFFFSEPGAPLCVLLCRFTL